jgi:hypothetical protein
MWLTLPTGRNTEDRLGLAFAPSNFNGNQLV